MFAFLGTWWIKAVAIVVTALALVGGGIFVANTWYERGAAAQKAADLQQQQKIQAADQTKITEAVHSNDQELIELRAFRDSHPAVPISVQLHACLPGRQASAPAGANSGAAPAPVVQPVPAAGSNSDISDADRGAMLQALAAAADTNSAQLRGVLKVVK